MPIGFQQLSTKPKLTFIHPCVYKKSRLVREILCSEVSVIVPNILAALLREESGLLIKTFGEKKMNAQLSFGVISPEQLYSFRAFKNLIGVSSAAIRSARKNGLQVHYAHKQGFVLGRDWIDYVTKKPKSNESNEDTGLGGV